MDYPGKVITKNQVTPTQTSATGVWTLDDAAAAVKNNNWPVAGVPNPISKSLRFNSADSAYLNRTFGTPTNNKIYTWNQWVKRSQLTASTLYVLASCPTAGFLSFGDGTNQVIRWNDGTADLISTPLYRDPSAWYMITVAVDTTQATSSDRVKIYVNGVQVTAFSTAGYPSLNASQNWNSAGVHNIGRRVSTSTLYYDGYMTEINFIDGQALTPSSFGMTDPVTGVWEPLKYSGTYGTNGFYLNFKDATSTTTLGYDYSGNANNWTTNNFSVTAGAGNDSLTDVPTPWIAYNTTGDVGGVVRGNYCTWNPIWKTGSIALNNGNLDASTSSATNAWAASTIGLTFDAYCEITVGSNIQVGLVWKGFDSGSWFDAAAQYSLFASGASGSNANVTRSLSATPSWSNGDILGLAWNNSARTLTLYINNVSSAVMTITSPTDVPVIAIANYTSGATMSGTANFGQRPFAYTPPSGFRSLCTTNLPASTVLKGSEYMNAVIYAGSASQQTIDSSLSILDVAWIKNRTTARDHVLVDTVRGGSPMLTLYPNQTYAEDNSSPNFNPTSISGSSIVLGGAKLGINNSGENFVLWGWNAGGSTVTNTSGTISAQVRANTTSGFSVVTYTGNGSSSQTFGHGLGVAPNMVIIKSRNNADNWRVFHSSVSGGNTLTLNTTAAAAAPGFWPSNPSSTVVFIGTDSSVNSNTWTYVSYCFAAISGFSAFGSYTGNASTDGAFLYLGFRPRFVMIKRTDTTADWVIYDSARDTYNVEVNTLYPNLSNAEGVVNPAMDFVSNGVKFRNSTSTFNASGGTYIYAAFAENPFKNALAR